MLLRNIEPVVLKVRRIIYWEHFSCIDLPSLKGTEGYEGR
jgi:hypothetical protein